MKNITLWSVYVADPAEDYTAILKDTGNGRSLYHVAELGEEPELIITATFFTSREAENFVERQKPGVYPDTQCRGIKF